MSAWCDLGILLEIGEPLADSESNFHDDVVDYVVCSPVDCPCDEVGVLVRVRFV